MKNTLNNELVSSERSILIVDYGMGNLRSLKSKIKMLGFEAHVSSQSEAILNAKALLFPGVGNFKKGMENLSRRNLIEPLNEAVLKKKIPILGICLGLQLFCKSSEEGNVNGLCWIDASVKKFSTTQSQLRVPHVGWNSLSFAKKDSFLFNGVDLSKDFYFTHSYQIETCPENQVLCKTYYGNDFISGVQKIIFLAFSFTLRKAEKMALK